MPIVEAPNGGRGLISGSVPGPLASRVRYIFTKKNRLVEVEQY